jgi:hypothetical protein
MSIQPHTSIFRHQVGTQTDACNWIKSQQGEPYSELRQAIPLAQYPDAPPASIDASPLPEGPFTPITTCPLTGRQLRLHAFRDLSCVLLRQNDQGGWEALPETLSITSEINDASLKEVPFEERYSKVPRIRIQARPEGFHWRLILGQCPTQSQKDTSEDDIRALFEAEMQILAEEILSAPPIADPRVHPNPPGRSRFAPCSVWPDLDSFLPEVLHAKEVVRHLATLHAKRVEAREIEVQLCRVTPATPWRENNRTAQVIARPYRGNLARIIREVLHDPGMRLPASLLFGPDAETIFTIRSIDPPVSRHAEIAAHEFIAKTLTSDTWQQDHMPKIPQ